MDKNRKFTVTWNELESLVNGIVTEQLHKYGILNEYWSGSDDSYDDSDDSDEYDFENISELEELMDMYEEGEIYTDDIDEDYGIQQDIRHYRRGEINFDLEELYNTLKSLDSNPNYNQENILNAQFIEELEDLIDKYENGEIDDDEDYGIQHDIRCYRRGEQIDTLSLYNELRSRL